jgi:hypothetical protein
MGGRNHAGETIFARSTHQGLNNDRGELAVPGNGSFLTAENAEKQCRLTATFCTASGSNLRIAQVGLIRENL